MAQKSKISKEELKDKLLNLEAKLNRTPSRREYIKEYGTTSGVYSHYRNWNDFVEDCNLEINTPLRYKTTTSNEEIISKLQELAKELNRVPTYMEFYDSLNPKITLYRRFGSYENLLKLAGLENHKRKYTVRNLTQENAVQKVDSVAPKEELLERIKYLSEKLDKTPTQKDYTKEYGSHYGIFKEYVRWNDLIKEAGLSVNKKTGVIGDLVGKTINELTILDEYKEDRVTFCKCKCSCGKICNVRKTHIKGGIAKSCGHLSHKDSDKLNSKSNKNKGVSWNKKTNKWRAYIVINKKIIYLGEYENINDAIEVRKKAEENTSGIK